MRVCGMLPSYTLLVFLTVVSKGDAILCSMCDTEIDGIRCMIDPPPPIECEEMVEYCTIVTKYNEKDELQTLTRTCMPYYFADSCMPGLDRRDGNKPVTLCTRTCGSDGCNSRIADSLPRRLMQAK